VGQMLLSADVSRMGGIYRDVKDAIAWAAESERR
jgi:hypothetical protein